jgi:hypothetical protein
LPVDERVDVTAADPQRQTGKGRDRDRGDADERAEQAKAQGAACPAVTDHA